jgi:ADP-dependent NAD(P)H-hydrate dehydratase / NAD(P)H-hydrate epimerase
MLGGLAGRRIILLAGKGNNGGDALAAARHLHNRGALCTVFPLYPGSDIRGDAEVNLGIIDRMGLQIIELTEDAIMNEFPSIVRTADLVVDGIFGTGLKGVVEGIAARVIQTVNCSGVPVLSIDIPSGVCGETGKILGSCMDANRTVTFCLPKAGLVVHPGCDHTGKLDVVDIGIPAQSIEQSGIKAHIIDQELVSGMLSARSPESNKGDFGKLLLLTGSSGMTGSGCLCADAALRTGAGLVYLGVPSALAHIYGASVLEPIVIPLADDGNERLSLKSMPRILEALGRMDAVAAGPGLTVCRDIIEIVELLLRECRVPLVLDADALNAISLNIAILKNVQTETVITPHPGEMARLAGVTTSEVMEDRVGIARGFAAKWGVITVLKGSRTIIALPDGRYYINMTGNPGMATGGSGDVLTGIISSLAGQGMKPADAAIAGVYLHGLAGDAAAVRLGQCGMLPRDMVGELPVIMTKVFGG